MANPTYTFTSESVSEGHPDKIADQISDFVLDAYLAKDPQARVAAEAFVTEQYVLLGGEVKSSSQIPIDELEEGIRDLICSIGYNDDMLRFNGKTLTFESRLHKQSREIHKAAKEGAGDQGIMFGYAKRSNCDYMPETIHLSNFLLKELKKLKHTTLDYLRPDAKSQVTINYEGLQAKSLNTIVISTQHNPQINQKTLRDDLRKHLIPKLHEECNRLHIRYNDYVLLINPSGSFVIGGPAGDTGLTGRKIIADTYGGWGAHGGGAFSGKDATKVDRSGAYAARYMAKNLVHQGIADEVLLQVSYAIGVSEPVSMYVTGQNIQPGAEKEFEFLRFKAPFTPQKMIDYFDLSSPRFLQTATYGHFGNYNFPWEKLDLDPIIPADPHSGDDA